MSFPMTFSYTSVFVFCSCPVSLHSWYVWILSWLLAHFVNGNVSTFRERILSFWFVHVHKHLFAWHSLSVNICWENAEVVNSWCWWTVCPRKEKQRLITGKVPMNNEASEISLFHFQWEDSNIAFCYILCVGRCELSVTIHLRQVGVWICTWDSGSAMNLLRGSQEQRDVQRSTSVQLVSRPRAEFNLLPSPSLALNGKRTLLEHRFLWKHFQCTFCVTGAWETVFQWLAVVLMLLAQWPWLIVDTHAVKRKTKLPPMDRPKKSSWRKRLSLSGVDEDLSSLCSGLLLPCDLCGVFCLLFLRWHLPSLAALLLSHEPSEPGDYEPPEKETD